MTQSKGNSQSSLPWEWRWSPRTLLTCTPAHLAQFRPMAQYVMERSGEHSIELVSFNLRFASRTWQRTCIPLEKPNHGVPYQRLCQRGHTPCDYQSSMPLQAPCLHLLECPLDSASSSPSYDNPTQTLHLLLKFQFLVSQLKLSWPPSVGRWERRMTMSFV